METRQLSSRLLDLCEEVERLEKNFGTILKEVEALESRGRELDVQLASTTPQAFYERVLSKLECIGGGDISFLLEVLNDGSEESTVSVEHGMGEASTGRYLSLQEKTHSPIVVVKKQDSNVVTERSSTMEEWLKLEQKYGSREGIVAYVRDMETDLARKAALLDAVTPAKMISRVKRKMSWVGDITLLCEALYDTVISATKATAKRQVVLLEARTVPRDAKFNVAAVMENKVSPKHSGPRTVGQKRRGRRALSKGALKRTALYPESRRISSSTSQLSLGVRTPPVRPNLCSTTRSPFRAEPLYTTRPRGTLSPYASRSFLREAPERISPTTTQARFESNEMFSELSERNFFFPTQPRFGPRHQCYRKPEA